MAIAFFMIEIEKIDDHHPIAENICFITRAISRAFIAWWRHNSETNERLFSGWITLQRALLIFNRTLRVRDQWRVLSNVCSLFCFSSLACMIDVFCNPLQGSAAASFTLIFYFCLNFPHYLFKTVTAPRSPMQLSARNGRCTVSVRERNEHESAGSVKFSFIFDLIPLKGRELMLYIWQIFWNKLAASGLSITISTSSSDDVSMQ